MTYRHPVKFYFKQNENDPMAWDCISIPLNDRIAIIYERFIPVQQTLSYRWRISQLVALPSHRSFTENTGTYGFGKTLEDAKQELFEQLRAHGYEPVDEKFIPMI